MENNKLTSEQLAKLLNGNTYGSEITKEQEIQAKESGLVVVFGYSDDNMELRGAIDDEISCYEGGEVKFDKNGKIIDEDDVDILEKYNLASKLNSIEAIWNHPFDETDERCSFQYETDIPHSKFRIMEDDELYCVGIVFSIEDLV